MRSDAAIICGLPASYTTSNCEMEHTALNAIRNTMTKTATALLMTKILFCIPTP